MMLSIRGIGLAAPFGDGTVLKQAATGTLPVGEIPHPRAEVSTEDLSRYVSPRQRRRIDHFTSMTLLAAFRALDNAGMLGDTPDRLGIVLCTGYGPAQTTFDFLDSIIDDGANLASPLAFSQSVHNIPAGVLSMILGSPCPQTTLCQHDRPVLAGLRTAALWLAEKRADHILLGAVDETTPFLKETARSFKDNAVPNFPVSEGASFFLLNNRGDGSAHLHFDSPDSFPEARYRFGPGPDGAYGPIEKLIGEIPVSGAFYLAAAALAVENSPQTALCYEGRQPIGVTGEP